MPELVVRAVNGELLPALLLVRLVPLQQQRAHTFLLGASVVLRLEALHHPLLRDELVGGAPRLLVLLLVARQLLADAHAQLLALEQRLAVVEPRLLEVYTIAERTGYSFKLKNDKGEWVMAVSEVGDPQTYVRLWRAWELLPVGESVPPPKSQPSQELPVREQKKANITNRERRTLDVPVLENPADMPAHPQPVANVVERAIQRDQLPERERKKSEKQEQ